MSTLRESLSNVARHARASRAELELSVHEDLHLRVLDDGVGVDSDMDIDQASQSTGNGLPNMTQRAGALGGSFAVRPRSGGGTEVSWRVPLA